MIVAECCIALSFVQFLRDLSTAAAQPDNKSSEETMKMRRRRVRKSALLFVCTVVYIANIIYMS